MRPEYSRIEQARILLAKHFPPTRLIEARSLAGKELSHVYLKLESELPTGSFKVRGAFYALWSRLQHDRVKEVVASSTGNHGAAVAYAAQLLKIPATIFLPWQANPVKRAKIAACGARIIEAGRDLAETFEHANSYAAREGAFFLNDANDPQVPEGTATIACEILEQLPDAATIYVPVGDTALIRGIGAAAKRIKPSVRIIGVQAERAPAYYLSWKERRTVTTESCDTIADGLATRTPIEGNVQRIADLLDDFQLVSDDEMLAAVRHLVLEEHIVAEPTGAATTAAFIQSGTASRGKIVLLVTGSNIAEEVLLRAFGQNSNRRV